MPSHKLGRTTEDIRREISAILRELKDPRVSGVMLSVVRVEVTNDLSYCTVYVSAMEGMDAAKNAVKGLRARRASSAGSSARGSSCATCRS